jgi:hypothetical protein
VRELRFKWRNGPWPNTGKRGLAGPPGATGPRGLAGNPGKEGAVVVLKENLKPREGEIKRIVEKEVSREVGDAEREIKARDRREMRRLETRLDETVSSRCPGSRPGRAEVREVCMCGCSMSEF